LKRDYNAHAWPTLFLVAVEALASEAVATSAIEGVHLNPNAAYAASWMRLQAREVTELKEQALAANPYSLQRRQNR